MVCTCEPGIFSELVLQVQLLVSPCGVYVQACFLKLLFLHSAGGLCLYRNEEWWTFELCYKNHVRQFHKEQNQVVSEYSLGTFQEEEVNQDEIKVKLAILAEQSWLSEVELSAKPQLTCPNCSDKQCPAVTAHRGPAESMSGGIKPGFQTVSLLRAGSSKCPSRNSNTLDSSA